MSKHNLTIYSNNFVIDCIHTPWSLDLFTNYCCTVIASHLFSYYKLSAWLRLCSHPCMPSTAHVKLLLSCEIFTSSYYLRVSRKLDSSVPCMLICCVAGCGLTMSLWIAELYIGESYCHQFLLPKTCVQVRCINTAWCIVDGWSSASESVTVVVGSTSIDWRLTIACEIISIIV